MEIKLEVRGEDLLQSALKEFRKQRKVAIGAINSGLFTARKELTTEVLPKRVDRPTPWTSRGLLITKVQDIGSSEGAWLRITPGRIYPKRSHDEQWNKLVHGGSDRSNRWYALVPPLRKNRYGNAPRPSVVFKRYQVNTEKWVSTKGLYSVLLSDGRRVLFRRGKKKGAEAKILAVKGTRKWRPRLRDYQRLLALATDRRILAKLEAEGWS